ncbi:hypothetical protein BDD12DRAFT_880836 [Trichophaea hybrida]|nr:hypothetical protein BDD12DRAFT_880836 [Trichophaea hybrida]
MSQNLDFTIITLWDPNHYNLTNEDLNTPADEPERRWNIHLMSYDTSTARDKPNGQRQLTICSVAVDAKIGFTLQVTATPANHILNVWVNHTIRLMSDALQVDVWSVTQYIRSDDDECQKAAAEQIIRIAKQWTIRAWSESKLADGELLVMMHMAKEHIVNLTWTMAEQQTLQQLVNRYESQGEGGAYQVHQ